MKEEASHTSTYILLRRVHVCSSKRSFYKAVNSISANRVYDQAGEVSLTGLCLLHLYILQNAVLLGAVNSISAG